MEEQESITVWLRKWSDGDEQAADALMPLVYGDLRRLAQSSLRGERFETTSATSLVHDLFLQLNRSGRVEWQDRGHFFGFAARILRQMLIQRARRRNAQKRQGTIRLAELSQEVAGGAEPDLLVLDEALRKLEALDPAKARLVELRYFCGLTMEEVAEATGVSLATAKRQWAFARRWLFVELQ